MFKKVYTFEVFNTSWHLLVTNTPEKFAGEGEITNIFWPLVKVCLLKPDSSIVIELKFVCG